MLGSIDFELLHEEKEGLKSKKAVLLFHGLTGSPFEMKKYGLFCFKLGFDVFCYSFPGHGDRLNEIEEVSWRDWVNFAQEKYSTLRKNYDQFFLSGLCLGAVVSLYLAEQNQDITGIIPLSTTLFLDGFCMPKRKVLLPLGLSTIFRFYYTFPEDNSLGIKNEDTRRKLAKIMSRTTVGMDNYPLNCVYELLELSKATRKNLSKITTPALIIHSKFDNLTSPKGAKLVYKNINSKKKEYIELKDSYHMVLYDSEKAYVMDCAKKFLEEFEEKSEEKAIV